MTRRELQALSQQLQEEKALVETFKTYAQRCEDPQLRIKCEQVAAKHQEHYNKLLHHLS